MRMGGGVRGMIDLNSIIKSSDELSKRYPSELMVSLDFSGPFS